MYSYIQALFLRYRKSIETSSKGLTFLVLVLVNPVNFEFPTPRAEIQPDEQNSSIEKTDFLVLLDIVGKLTDDIRGLQVKIDEYGSRNERLLLEHCEMTLDIATF